MTAKDILDAAVKGNTAIDSAIGNNIKFIIVDNSLCVQLTNTTSGQVRILKPCDLP